MGLKARTNVDKVCDDLDAFARDVEQIALPRALVKLGNQASVSGTRVAAQQYGIKSGDLKPYIEVVVDRGGLQVTVVTRGKGFPLRVFRPRRTPRGIEFTVKGHRIEIPHGFEIKKFGHFFARGRYGQGGPEQARTRRGARKSQLDRGGRSSLFQSTGEQFGRFAYGRARFPIALLRSASPPDAMSSPEVVDAMQDRIEEQAPKLIRQEIAAIRRGF